MGDGEHKPRNDPFKLFLVVACVALAVLVVLLTWQNMGLKSRLAESQTSEAERLQDGEPLGALALTPEGAPTRELVFGDGEARTLLLIFSVHCPACNQTMPMWEELVRDVRDTAGLRIIGVQTDQPGEGEESELLTAALPFAVYGLDRQGSPGMARIPYIPATIVLDTAGVAQRVWFGMPSEDDLAELRDVLGS